MNNQSTGKRLLVSKDGTTGPYIMVPVPQLDDVRALLDRNEIGYWVDSAAISINEEPAIAVINLGRNVDPRHVQTLLDHDY